MKELNTYIVLDRSGSMWSNWTETLGSVNGYARALKDTDEIHNTITVIVFDTINPFELVRDAVTLEGWNDITAEEISPRGGTPLYTAVVKTLELAQSVDHEKVVMVVMTDGQDTGNVEHTIHSAKAAIEDATKNKGWEVIFLGANFDAAHYTQAFGLHPSKFVNTNNITRGATMSMMATKSMSYASASNGLEATIAMSFTEEEQKVAEGKPTITPDDGTKSSV